jgi:hypothetical protein
LCEAWQCGAKSTSILSLGGVETRYCTHHFKKTFGNLFDPSDIFVFKRVKVRSKSWGVKTSSNETTEYKLVPIKAVLPEWIDLDFKTIDRVFSGYRSMVGGAWRYIKERRLPIIYHGEVVEYGPLSRGDINSK